MNASASLLKKYWPSIAHAAGILILFLDPAVKGAALTHPKYTIAITIAWGWALHWATAPKNADTVAAVKKAEAQVDDQQARNIS